MNPEPHTNGGALQRELDAVAGRVSQQVLCRLVEVVVLDAASNVAEAWRWERAGCGVRARKARKIGDVAREIGECAKGDWRVCEGEWARW